MSSTGPTRQALTRLINNVDTAPSQRDRWERRPSEKALYQVEEAQDREDRRQGNQAKSKVTRKRVSPHDGTQVCLICCLFHTSLSECPLQFSAHNVSLSKPLPTVPLDLRPRLSKVPPQEKQTPRQQRPPQVSSFFFLLVNGRSITCLTATYSCVTPNLGQRWMARGCSYKGTTQCLHLMDADACHLQESGFINANHACTSNSNISALALTSQSESTVSD
jgi:hypothetical protein